MELRPFQNVGINHAISWLKQANRGDKRCYAAPTGSGKSVVEIGVRDAFPDLWIVTPRDEIVDGILDKLGATDAMANRITTPVKLRNRLMSGEVSRPSHLIFDEGHHHNAETWQQISLLSGLVPSLAYTATPYRGTPKSTREFLDAWGEPIWLISYAEAAREGYIKVPHFSILPLVDDDIVEVSGGEFEVTSLDSVTMNRLQDIVDHAAPWYGATWDMSTIFAVPSTYTAFELQRAMSARGLPTAIISGSTPRSERRLIFEACRHGILALIHINIVTEGVDEPFRRYVDLAPTLSPVNWVQKLGRITRPWAHTPIYICTNRNLLRHAYALEGIVPISALAEAEKLFGPTTRAHSRVLGLEAIGRFKPTTTKMLDGTNVYVYAMSALEGVQVVEYACLCHPARDPFWAKKVSAVKEDRTRDYGTWALCPAPTSLQGFASKGMGEPTVPMLKWWVRAAAHYGLDPDQEVTRKSFTALPVLANVGGWPCA